MRISDWSSDVCSSDLGIEKLSGGTWQLVISEIPYGFAKGKLIEQIAQLIADKKLPILEDVRDESAEDLRIVLEPKSRNVDPEVLKESLFRLTDLESRFALNLNVLDATRTPKVMGLKQLLTEWLQHQIIRSEEHTSELQSLMRISYAVFCLKKKKTKTQHPQNL